TPMQKLVTKKFVMRSQSIPLLPTKILKHYWHMWMHFALSKIHYWGQKLSERTNKSLSKQNTFAHVIMEQTCFFYLQVAQSHLSIHFFPPNEETNSYNS